MMRPACRMLPVLLIAVFSLQGCPTPEDFYYPMDIDVGGTDGQGNPTQILITDLGSDLPNQSWQDSRVVLVNLDGDVLWQFDSGGGVLDGAHNADFIEPGDRMIISDSSHNRVLIISYPEKQILWNSNIDCPELDLNYPNDANYLENGNLLITNRDDHWVFEVDTSLCNGTPDGEIVWSFGVKGVPRTVSNNGDLLHLNSPHNADRLPNGNTVIADSGPMFSSSRVIEVDPDYPGEPNKIVWNYQQMTDCTVRQAPDKQCPGLFWCRDADVECNDPTCETGLMVATGIHQTVGVLRDLNEAPPPGESIPRGREVPYRVEHSEGFCYDSDWIPKWNGSTNNGKGFFLVSNHGPSPLMFVRVVRVGAQNDFLGMEWQLPTPFCTDNDGDGWGNPGAPQCPMPFRDCNDANPNINPGMDEGPFGAPTCSDGIDNDCDGDVDLADEECITCDGPADCDDGNPCTDQDCVLSHCVFTDNTGPCDDGDACTMNDICLSGMCYGDPLDADGDNFVSDACGGADCDDGDENINPGVTEGPFGDPMCSDDADNDCDGLTDGADDGCQA